MDPLMQHLQAQGLKVTRSAAIQDIPIVKVDSEAPRDDKLSAVLAYLVSRGNQRPASMKTLVGSISALFNPRLDEPATKALIDELEANGIFTLNGAKIVYSLPDLVYRSLATRAPRLPRSIQTAPASPAAAASETSSPSHSRAAWQGSHGQVRG